MPKLTVLVVPLNAVGHVNACAGALVRLLDRGHRVVFLLESAFRGKLENLGYEEYVYTENDNPQKNPGEFLAKILVDFKILGPHSPSEKVKNMSRFIELHSFESFKKFDLVVREAIEFVKPDVIYVDGGGLVPAIAHSGIPWIRSNSTNPLLAFFGDGAPPGGFGIPSSSNSKTWPEYDDIRRLLFYSSRTNDFIHKLGYERYPDDLRYPPTQILTVYACPEELNYDPIRESDWFNLEVFTKVPESKNVELKELVPVHFLEDTMDGKFSGKFVYVSMGSMASVDLGFMGRLVGALSKSNHKYIVSKGPLHSQYTLGPNMYGDRYLDQTRILPLIDLVITHGGNNTVTETFALGKPMIVFPLFGDQYDNAQRLQETGFGSRMDPYDFTDNQLIDAVDRLLEDEQINERIQQASKRIQSRDMHEELAIKIEQLIKKD